jgi:hypothetical protein
VVVAICPKDTVKTWQRFLVNSFADENPNVRYSLCVQGSVYYAIPSFHSDVNVFCLNVADGVHGQGVRWLSAASSELGREVVCLPDAFATLSFAFRVAMKFMVSLLCHAQLCFRVVMRDVALLLKSPSPAADIRTGR